MILVLLIVALIMIAVSHFAIIFYYNRWRLFKNCGADSFRFLSVSDVLETLDAYDINHKEYDMDKRNEAYARIRSKAVSFNKLGKIVRLKLSKLYNELTEEE